MPITVGKVYFYRNTKMCWGIDQFFKNIYRPMVWNHYLSSLRRKSINMLILPCKKEYLFKEDLLMAVSHRKTPVLEFLFNSVYCKIFKSTYFEEYLHMDASENVLWKGIKISKEFWFYIKNRFFQHQYQKQVKMFVVSYEVCIHK